MSYTFAPLGNITAFQKQVTVEDGVEESPLAQEISKILADHPGYYAEFRTLVGGIFPEPKGKSA